VLKNYLYVGLVALTILFGNRLAYGQVGSVKSYQKITENQGGFTGVLDGDDRFGSSVTAIGDLNNDGITDIAVGATIDAAVWVLFLNKNGTVQSHQKIGQNQGGFTGEVNGTAFGESLTSLGDLDGDGFTEIVVGGGAYNVFRGAVWILFLQQDGTVKNYQMITENQGGFTGDLDEDDTFGSSVACLGDVDGDGIVDLAVGAKYDADGGFARGAVWVLFLNSDGTVKGHQKISSTSGGFTGQLDNSDFFGWSVASLDDFDDDGIIELCVGAVRDDDGGTDRGAIWILFLNSDGTVKYHQKISNTQGNFTGYLSDSVNFGRSVANLGYLNGDRTQDLVVGAVYGGGSSKGAVWELFLTSIANVQSNQEITENKGNFTGSLDVLDCFGVSVASLGDLDEDGVPDAAVGAYFDDDAGTDSGALWLLFLFRPLTLTTPNGGEIWTTGIPENVQWNVGDSNIPEVKIEYSSDKGRTWNYVDTAANIGKYTWLIPEVNSSDCLVRISDANDANNYDMSKDVFTISKCFTFLASDLTGDCYVDWYDFAIFALDWLKCGDPNRCGPYEWKEYNGHHYAATRYYSNWSDAEAEARSFGGHLVTVNDANENAWLTDNFGGYYTFAERDTHYPWSSLIWIGLECAGGDVHDPNCWQWINNEPVTYMAPWWDPDLPNAPHAYLHPSTHPNPGTWWNSPGHDTDPNAYPRGIIELPW